MAQDQIVDSEIGVQLRGARGRAGLTSGELAASIGLSPFELSRIEHGERPLSLGELLATCAGLNLSADQLIEGELDPVLAFAAGDSAQLREAKRAIRKVIDDYLAFAAAGF